MVCMTCTACHHFTGKASLLFYRLQQTLLLDHMTLLLACVFHTTNGTVSWEDDGQPIASGDNFVINSMFNETASVYITELVIDAASTVELKGVVSCHAQSTQRVQMDDGVKIVNAKGRFQNVR